jgi:hypothetical protein
MKCWIWFLLLTTAFGQSTNASPTGREWSAYSESFRTGYVLGFMNGTSIGAFREMSVCFQLTKISLGLINTTNDFLERYKEKYPDIVIATTSQIFSQTDRPEFKQDFCVKSIKTGFENITVGQFLSGVNAFYSDYRNQSIPVNYAIQYVRDDINGKSPAEQNAALLLERKCIADPAGCLESKSASPK